MDASDKVHIQPSAASLESMELFGRVDSAVEQCN